MMNDQKLLNLLRLNVFVQSAIIVTGAIVRITKSGLGCPTWPQCVGNSIIPIAEQEESWHKYVEFGNRLLTFVLLVVAVLVFFSIWKTQKNKQLTLLALAPGLGTLIQAILGGVTVLTGLHPITVSAHFLVSILIVGLSYLLLVKVKDPKAKFGHNPLSLIFLMSAFITLTLGTIVTGSGPHSGDQFASSRFAFDLTTIANIHSKSVWLFILISVILAIKHFSQKQGSNRNSFIYLGISVAIQAGIGYYQFHQGVPEVLVFLHVIGATIFWIACLNLFFKVILSDAKLTHQDPPQKR